MDCKPVTTPLEARSKLQKGKYEIDFPYQSLIRCLMYIAINTRPNIALAVSLMHSCYSLIHATMKNT